MDRIEHARIREQYERIAAQLGVILTEQPRTQKQPSVNLASAKRSSGYLSAMLAIEQPCQADGNEPVAVDDGPLFVLKMEETVPAKDAREATVSVCPLEGSGWLFEATHDDGLRLIQLSAPWEHESVRAIDEDAALAVVRELIRVYTRLGVEIKEAVHF